MNIVFGIILALLVFSLIVFVHELGHFFLAKKSGVKVEEFGIGIPPRAVQIGKDKSGTLYTLNWLPIGGFVKMRGEEMDGSGIRDPKSLASKNFLQQSGVILAGVVMNFIFAFVIFSALFAVGVEPLAINTKFHTNTETKLIPSFDEAVRVGIIKTDGIAFSPLTGSVAERSGIMEGDVLLKIDGKVIGKPDELIEYLKSSTGSIAMELRSSSSIRNVSVVPVNGKIGSYVGYNVTDIDKNFRYKYSFLGAIGAGATETYTQSRMTLELLGNLFSKIFTPRMPSERNEAVRSLGGPIAVGNLFINLIDAKVALSVIALVAALISINLGVFNLLPFPALDGGRFAFLIISRIATVIFGKKAAMSKIEHYIHILGFSLLILVSIFVAYNDIVKIVMK